MSTRVLKPDLAESLSLRISAWLTRDEGQGLTEYALILALVAIIAITGLHLLGTSVTDVVSTAGNGIQG